MLAAEMVVFFRGCFRSRFGSGLRTAQRSSAKCLLPRINAAAATTSLRRETIISVNRNRKSWAGEVHSDTRSQTGRDLTARPAPTKAGANAEATATTEATAMATATANADPSPLKGV